MSQYEMHRMQTSVPDVMDVSNEPDYIFDMYGEDSKTPEHLLPIVCLQENLLKRM